LNAEGHFWLTFNNTKKQMFRKIEPECAAPRQIAITIDEAVVAVEEGEPVAAILLRTPPFTSRTTPVSGAPRAPFCMMGACFECLVEIDGETSTRSCLVGAVEGMTVRRQLWRPVVSEDGAA